MIRDPPRSGWPFLFGSSSRAKVPLSAPATGQCVKPVAPSSSSRVGFERPHVFVSCLETVCPSQVGFDLFISRLSGLRAVVSKHIRRLLWIASVRRLSPLTCPYNGIRRLQGLVPVPPQVVVMPEDSFAEQAHGPQLRRVEVNEAPLSNIRVPHISSHASTVTSRHRGIWYTGAERVVTAAIRLPDRESGS